MEPHRENQPGDGSTSGLLRIALAVFLIGLLQFAWSGRGPLFYWIVAGLFAAALSIATFAVWRWIARRRMPSPPRGSCKTCGYDLVGDMVGRCPECGTARKQIVKSARPVDTIKFALLKMALVGGGGVVCTLLIWAMGLTDADDRWNDRLVKSIVIVAAGVIGLIVWLVLHFRRRRK